MDVLFYDKTHPAVVERMTPPASRRAADQWTIDFIWTLGCTGKVIWPIPDKGLAKRIHRISAPTLVAWHRNFETWWETSVESERPRIRGSQEMFRRMWRYYLLSCAASFATGYNEVWQFVYARGHLPEGYEAVR